MLNKESRLVNRVVFERHARKKFFLLLSILLHYLKTKDYIGKPYGGPIISLHRSEVFEGFSIDEVHTMHTTMMYAL
jgi:hypothetical protein